MSSVHPNNIKKLRKERGLTQQALGQKFKSPKDITIISRWERGVVKPSANSLIELCEILQVKKPNDIFFESN
ncbi:helix-turn-helix domain-containing protein [Paenibacillus graminis]|uniref:helix-turn-helix domain-containing protein n=1 Tax=Paenibacillus graminis TaxID=189425 RepID=UPI00398B40B3